MNPLRVLLADDHTLVRAGLRKLLESIPDVEVVGEAADGLALLALALGVCSLWMLWRLPEQTPYPD